MSRTKHHRDALSPRRYRMRDWPSWHRVLRARWQLREELCELVAHETNYLSRKG